MWNAIFWRFWQKGLGDLRHTVSADPCVVEWDHDLGKALSAVHVLLTETGYTRVLVGIKPEKRTKKLQEKRTRRSWTFISPWTDINYHPDNILTIKYCQYIANIVSILPMSVYCQDIVCILSYFSRFNILTFRSPRFFAFCGSSTGWIKRRGGKWPSKIPANDEDCCYQCRSIDRA